MSGRGAPKRRTFAEIVAAAEAIPVATTEPPKITPGRFSDEVLYDLGGHPLYEVDGASLTPVEVRAAALGGDRVMWDACGCGGYCNSGVWLDPTEVRREAEQGAPRPRKNELTRVTRFARADGDPGGDVIVVAGSLRWGDLFR